MFSYEAFLVACRPWIRKENTMNLVVVKYTKLLHPAFLQRSERILGITWTFASPDLVKVWIYEVQSQVVVVD